MAEPVEVTFDAPRRLIYQVRHIIAMEERLGRSIFVLAGVNLGMKEVRALLWCGLRPDNPKITLEDAAGLLQDYIDRGGSTLVLITKINDALERCGVLRAADEEVGNGMADPTVSPSSSATGSTG